MTEEVSVFIEKQENQQVYRNTTEKREQREKTERNTQRRDMDMRVYTVRNTPIHI